MNKIILAIIPIILTACGSESGDVKRNQEKPKKEIINSADAIPAERIVVRKDPVASYRVKTDDPLNDFYFSVELFETNQTFAYLMKLEFENIYGKDTLRLPNFGAMPEPVLKKGPEKYSVIIGFLDKDKQFREYKKVYATGNKLKVTALRHYGVATYQP